MPVGQAARNAIRAKERLELYKSAAPQYEVSGHDAASVRARVPAAVVGDDMHVAAAALVLRDYAQRYRFLNDRVYIVSSNLKHLAVAEMRRLGVLVVAPGRFIDSLTNVADTRVAIALNNCVSSLKNPPYTRARLLDALALHGARATALHFARVWGETLSTRS